MPSIAYHNLEQIVARMQAGSSLIQAAALRGGASAQVRLLDVHHAGGERQKYLLRIHSEVDRSRNPDIADDEFKLLKVLHDSGLPVPQPHYLDGSGEVFPLPYLIVGYIDGATDFTPSDLPGYLQQSAALLAQIHQTRQRLGAEDWAALDFLSERSAHAQWWISYEPEQLDEMLDEAALRATLREVFPLSQTNEATLLHGDFWPGNLIWWDGQLVGVIDWEDAEIGDPLSDLGIARLDMLWAFGQEAMHDFTQAYQAHMPQLDYGNLPHWDLFSALRPANQLGDWVAGWAEVGRPEVTLTTLQTRHRWFVAQARAQL